MAMSRKLKLYRFCFWLLVSVIYSIFNVCISQRIDFITNIDKSYHLLYADLHSWNYLQNGKLSKHKIFNSNLKPDYIQSALFPLGDNHFFGAGYEHLFVLNPSTGYKKVFKVYMDGKSLKNGYHISLRDSMSQYYLIKGENYLFWYDLKNNIIKEVISKDCDSYRFTVDNKNKIIYGIRLANGAGLDKWMYDEAKQVWTHKHFLIPDKQYKETSINRIEKTDSTFMLGTSNGLYKYSPSNDLITKIQHNFGDFNVEELIKNSKELLVLSKKHGILSYNCEENSLSERLGFKSINKQFRGNIYNIFSLEKDKLLLSFKDKPFKIINLGLLEKIQNYKSKNQATIKKLMNTRILTIQNKNDIYFLDDNKLFYTDGDKATLVYDFKSDIIFNVCLKNNSVTAYSNRHQYEFNNLNNTPAIYPQNLNEILLGEYEFGHEKIRLTTEGYLIFNGYREFIGIPHSFYNSSKFTIFCCQNTLKIIDSYDGADFEFDLGCPIYGATMDENSNIWVTTNQGLFFVDKLSCEILKIPQNMLEIESLTRPLSFNEKISVHDAKGNLLDVNTDSYIHLKNQPGVFVSKVTLDNDSINFNSLEHVPSDFLNLSFSVLGIDMFYNKDLKVFYRILGLKEDWTQCSANGNIEIQRLPYGTYTLQYYALGDNNVKSNIEVKTFTVLKPYFLRPWFLLLTAVFIFSLGYFIQYIISKNKLRFQKLELDKLAALEKQRQQLSRDLHDEIGSGLSIIKIISSAHTNKENVYEDIAALSSSLIGNMRDMLWSLDHENDSVEDLVSKIRSSVQAQLKNMNMTLKFNNDITCGSKVISGLVRRNLLLIVKEAIHNVIKHANADQVAIQINDKESKLTITISDNGNQNSEKSTRDSNKAKYGIDSMHKRAADIGSDLKIKSTNSGWIVCVRHPLTD